MHLANGSLWPIPITLNLSEEMARRLVLGTTLALRDDPYGAQKLLREHEEELGIRLVPFQAMVYVENLDTYLPDLVDHSIFDYSLCAAPLHARILPGLRWLSSDR